MRRFIDDTDLPPSENKDKVQISTANIFPLMYMNMSWYPEWGLQFGILIKKGQQLSYVGKGSTHTPGTLHAIPLGVLNYLAKLT